MRVAPGATSNSMEIQFVDDSGLPLTGFMAVDFPTMSYTRVGAVPVTISLHDTGQTNTYSSGGVVALVDGWYRLDYPDAAVATANPAVQISGDTAGKHVIAPQIECGYAASNAVQLNGTGLTGRDIGASVLLSAGTGSGQIGLASGSVTVGTNNDKTGYTASLDLTQAIPTSNTNQTLGDALNAARAQGFGKWVLSGTTLTLYAADGTTAVRTFTLDSSTTPTQRV